MVMYYMYLSIYVYKTYIPYTINFCLSTSIDQKRDSREIAERVGG